MSKKHFCALLFCIWLGALSAHSQALVPGKNTPLIRGKPQALYFYPGAAERMPETKPIVLFVCGDGGWRGFSITIAQTIASWGYNTFGFDSKVYLEAFTGKTTLQEAEVAEDFRTLMQRLRGGTPRLVVLTGWSEGAGLALLGASAPANRDIVQGLVAIGLPEKNILGWRFIDSFTYLTKRDPNEPMFESAKYLPQLAPVPFLMINSTNDEYAPLNVTQQLFVLAKDPKKYVVIDARNHRFDGNKERFFGELREGLQWIEQARR